MCFKIIILYIIFINVRMDTFDLILLIKLYFLLKKLYPIRNNFQNYFTLEDNAI